MEMIDFENAKDKAEALAAVVGAKIRRVVSFQENVGGVPQPIYYGKAMGMGMAAEAAPAPTVEAGSSEIVVTADVTYEIE